MDCHKKQYPNSAQKSRLCQLIEGDEELRKGKFSGSFTKKVSEQKWKYIADELNSLGGANKSWIDWRKTWQDMKSKTKKKQANIRRSQNSTGGGPPAPSLTENDTSILNTMSDAVVMGHTDSTESRVYFQDQLFCPAKKIFPPIAPAAASVVVDTITSDIPEAQSPLLSTLNVNAHENHGEDQFSLQNTSPPEVRTVTATETVVTEILEPGPSTSAPIIVNECGSNMQEPRKKKTKRTLAQTRLQNSLDTAVTLVQVLKEKNEIKKIYYENKIIEMKRQSDALMKIANALLPVENENLEDYYTVE